LSTKIPVYAGYAQAKPPGYIEELVHTGPGTACGELFRRYWQPVAIADEIDDLPRPVRILNEDLVVFRTQPDDGSRGELALVHRNCPHRRASLAYGRCEARGIRCCYHGWLFAPDGEVLETPGEAPDAAAAQSVRENTRLGAYPVHEYGGLLFAYLGPPQYQPEFPIYDASSISDIETRNYSIEYNCNWLQVLDAIMDPLHTSFLHSQNSVPQFSEGLAEVGEMQFYERGLQFLGCNTRRVEDHVWLRVNELILPNFTQAGAAFAADGTRSRYFGRSSFTRWVVPIDDHRCISLAWASFGERADPPSYNSQEGCELIEQGELVDRTEEQRQRRPADAEAVEGMGTISAHKGEHLMPTDRGIALYRRGIRRLLRNLDQGKGVPQPQQMPGESVRTYGQDTVLRIPASASSGNDRDLLQRVEQQIMSLQFESESMPLADRDQFVIAQLQKMEKDGFDV